MNDNVIEQQICDTLEKNYMPYAMSVIISRAIPEIDGFKPSHRKLLYTMYKMGLINGNRTKSANVVGQTMKLNPHGDMAIYDTLVRLTRGNAALLHPLIDSKGNFGKQYSRDMAYAAPRYTEVKLEAICNEVFKNIDKNTVAFIDNYDGTMKEPVLLPVTFPNILVNPNQGIAVGMASSICSFNLIEVCNATIAYLKHGDCNISEHIIAPDFSTGGEIVYDKTEIENILATGRGGFKVRAKYRFDKANSCIEVFEIPYTTTCEAIIDKIIDVVKSGRIKEINDVRDETDLNGLKITIDIKKAVDADGLMSKLFKTTPLEDSFGCNFNILVNGAPKVMGAKEILGHWCDFRVTSIKGNLEYDIKEKEAKLHLLRGLQSILLDIDRAISIIRNTEKEDEVVPNLMVGFNIDDIQADYVAEIRLRNVNKEYILKRINEVEQLLKDIEYMKNLLSNEKEIRKVIISELSAISKKYGNPRKTTILEKDSIDEVHEDQFIEDYRLKLFLTRENYIKKISLVSLRGASEHKLKQGDEILCEFEASNKDDLLFFSNMGEVYKMRIHEISDCKASVLGEYLPNLLGLTAGEEIVYITSTTDYSGHMLFAFENGKMAKVEMKSYETKTNRKKLTGAYYTRVKLVSMMYLATDCDILITSKGGRALIINTSLITAKSKRDTQGIQVYLSKRDAIIEKATPLEGSYIEDVAPYYSNRIPSSGGKLKTEDLPHQQLNMLDLE